MASTFDTSNRFKLVTAGDRIGSTEPIPQSMSRDEALLLAAWLVLLADPDGEQFQLVLGSVQTDNDHA
jgi:hypothetical protein